MREDERLSLLYPPFASALREVAKRARGLGVDLVYTNGLRTFEEQYDLWLLGRDPSGTIVDRSKIVTNAPPGSSWHQWGLACDFALVASRDGERIISIDWSSVADLDHDGIVDWLEAGTAAEAEGLKWGGRWRSPDLPHLEYPVTFSLADARKAFSIGGISKIWSLIA
jgi:peptidoglycan L-alanyl-D-glutamate endopeptidase CwlK